MGLDIRLPIGMMFTVLGVLLSGYGLIADKAIFARSLGINIDLIWGGALLLFGIVFVIAGRRAGHSASMPRARASNISRPR
jgi:hypothetical protein